MPVAEFGDLWQVGNADDLVMIPQIGQFFSHDFGHPAADTGLDRPEDRTLAGREDRGVEIGHHAESADDLSATVLPRLCHRRAELDRWSEGVAR